MKQFTVYQDPKDLPYRYAVRAWYIIQGRTDPVPEQEWWAVGNNDDELKGIRERLADMGLTPLPRYPADDPAILEVWI